MSAKKYLVSQFKKPTGILGSLAGHVMANRPSNIERNIWMIDLLNLKPTDRLLEVGFGPGIAIQNALQTITEGRIVGIDHSERMLRQAQKRNSSAINSGLVKLYHGDLKSLPTDTESFDKICSANVVQFWTNPSETFSTLRSMLAVGGLIATTYMARHEGATSSDSYVWAGEISSLLEDAGFSSIHVEEKLMEPVSAITVLAKNNG